jgi:hypothetical protein
MARKESCAGTTLGMAVEDMRALRGEDAWWDVLEAAFSAEVRSTVYAKD